MKSIGKMNQNLLGLALAALLAMPVSTSAGGVADATEITQIMNNVQLVMAYVEQVEQTSTQLKQYQTMLQNLQQMTPSGQLDQAAVALWRDQNMNQAFMSLRTAVVNGQRVSYSLANLDQHFKRQYPGYGGPIDFGVAYRDWSDNTLDAVKNATALMAVHADEFATEEGTIRELQNKSRSAQGQMAALQAGNQVGIATVSQLQKLRQLQMAQMQAQNAHIAAQQSNADADAEVMRQFLDRRTKVRSIAEIEQQQKGAAK